MAPAPQERGRRRKKTMVCFRPNVGQRFPVAGVGAEGFDDDSAIIEDKSCLCVVGVCS